MNKKLFIILILTISFIIPFSTYAKDDVKIKSIEMVEKTDTTEIVEEPSIKDLEVKFNIKFTSVGDSVKYKLVIENKSDKDYTVNKNLDSSEYITYTLDTKSNIVKSNSKAEMYIIVEYKNTVPSNMYTNGKFIESKNININLNTGNPLTSTSSNIIILISILILGGLLYYSLKNNNKKMLNIIVLGIVLIPLTTKAIDVFTIKINSNIEIEDNILSALVCKDAKSSEGLNFYYSAGTSGYGTDGENGKSGVYTYTEDGKDICYYRGEVDNNNVVFNNMCWKIVRTTSTGGTKLIYNGKYSEENKCNNTSINSRIGSYGFNLLNSSPADVGYKYGKRYISSSIEIVKIKDEYVYGNDVEWDGKKYKLIDTTTSVGSNWYTDRKKLAEKYHYTCFNTTSECTEVYYVLDFGYSAYTRYLTFEQGIKLEDAKSEMFDSNTNDSNIKIEIEKWYSTNMNSYTEYFEDEEFCNDRSIYSGSLKSKDTFEEQNSASFGAYGRLAGLDSKDVMPSLSCEREKDAFSVANGELKYPVALLSIDEISLAGLGTSKWQETNYLYTGFDWWSMSPYSFGGIYAMSYKGYRNIGNMYSNTATDVRPSLSLKSNTIIKSGTGTAQDPYRVID